MSTSSDRASWLGRSRQRWKLRLSFYVATAVALYGGFLYFTGTDVEVFIGLLLIMAAAVISFAGTAFVRCRACGHRVALDAPFGHWESYTERLQACPMCGDDGEGNPPASGELSVWQQVAREVAAREREERRVRNRRVLRAAFVVLALALASWLALRRLGS